MGSAGSGLGSAERPLRVAIIGSGPSGFYAADALFKSGLAVHVHMFERFPTPYGLVRFGVAPDHAKIRTVTNIYAKTASHDNYRYWGNVTIGRDLTIAELEKHFDAIIFAFGAETDRKLNIPGIELPRSYTATAFCAWYNGHPDYRDCHFDLSHEVAVVIGQGNVAMDVTRVLAKPVDELAKTDMASHAIEQLAESKVRDIYCIGRRGPAQAAFTPKEISELGEIPGCDVIVDPKDVDLSDVDKAELELPESKSNVRNMESLVEFSKRRPTGAKRRIIIRFFQSPTELHAAADGGVGEVVLETNKLSGEPGKQKARGTGETETLACDVFFRSIGYHGVGIEGVPFNADWGVIPNELGRVEPGKYAVGWIKRGPSGLIGTNKKDSEESVQQLLADAPSLGGCAEPSDDAVTALLDSRGVRVVRYADWLKIDAAELERGKAKGKPRDNFTSVAEMLAVLDQ
ncbi:MAG: NADP oxidoreductase [Phycisphaera sp.]|nr:NADP oxidoreductase [Phycisphaera sp.]